MKLIYLVNVLLIAAYAKNVTDNEVFSPPRNFLSTKGPVAPAAASITKDSTSAEMEAAVTDLLAGKGEFAATPMGGSVKQIRDIIKKTMMDKVKQAHRADQSTLRSLNRDINSCGSTKQSSLNKMKPRAGQYKRYSKVHKSCRGHEAVKRSSKQRCHSEQRSMKITKKLKCDIYAAAIRDYGTQKANSAVVRRAMSEATETYITRISNTFCGRHVHGSKGRKKATGGWGGGLVNSYLDKYLKAKDGCVRATRNYNRKVKECRRKTRDFRNKKAQCNSFQALMDSNSCSNAVGVKDACEAYAGCYTAKVNAYKSTEKRAKAEQKDRKAEWRGLERMACLIDAFADGKVKDKEVDTCKKRTVDTKHLNLKYYRIPKRQMCRVPNLYPSTGPYLRKEFQPLPSLAKGKQSAECTGLEEISVKPRKGSPKSCRCTRINLNGPYSAGAMVKCVNCWDVRRSTQKNSCPVGTKLFSPASRSDWNTFRRSTGIVRAPHFIVDVTRPQNGCGGSCKQPMNSQNAAASGTWRTSDGSPWWLRSKGYKKQPSGDYHANCFLHLWGNMPNDIRYNDYNCNYHSKSYFCQLKRLNLAPKRGSPKGCKCTKVNLAGPYSAGQLVRCSHCLSVSNKNQKNSCPYGMKIFSPRSRRDWKTVLNSGGAIRAPHWIVDVTRPQNGCAGCKRHAMNSKNPHQASWRTSDGSPWWLRSTRYGEPNGNYRANCYLGLWPNGGTGNENSIQFDDWDCNFRAHSYYCQPIKRALGLLK